MLEGFTPWPEEFGRIYRENGYWSDLTLGEMLESSIKKYGPKEALIYGDLRITYNQLGEKVNRLAHHFWDLGLKPLDLVVFQLANTLEVDDNENEVPDGQTGELIVRGPYTIRGYYKAPEHNSKSFTVDGFYRTGDIVRKNERGYLFTEGRKKDLINRGGEKISCDEVENYILANPKIENVCLVAMPDEVFGEKACAFVLLKAGETITFEELKDFLRKQHIASFKLPERLEIVSAFPLSPAGKILKRKLREDIIEKLAKEKAPKNS